MGPWESVPATPQTGGGGRTGGLAFRARASIGGAGQQGVMPRSRAAAMPCAMKRPFLNPDATRRRIFAPPCAMLRRACLHQGPGTRHVLQPRQQERQPTCAACPNLAATAVSAQPLAMPISPGFLRRDWVRFAVFFIDTGRPRRDEHARPPCFVRGRRQGWRAAPAASRQSARRNPIPPRGVLQDNSHSPGARVLADRRYGPRAATRTGSCEVSIS